MEQENLKGGAAGQIADLRRQLSQMTMASQMLEQCAFDEKSREYLAYMNQGICRMLRIVGRMQMCDRLDKESPDMKLEPTDLGELTADLGARMEGLLDRAGVKLEVSAPERLMAGVNREMIRQLLLELVANAAKAVKGTKAEGRVTLTLKRDKNDAVFTIEDNGPGVPPEKIPFLFDSEKEDLPDWRRGGCGIAMARRIAALHGGRLAPLCRAGRGLVIAVSIPLNQGAEQELHSPQVKWDSGGFGDAMVGLSHLLPPEVFVSEDYE